MNKKIAIIVAIGLIIVLAGCTQPQKEQSAQKLTTATTAAEKTAATGSATAVEVIKTPEEAAKTESEVKATVEEITKDLEEVEKSLG